LAFLTQNKAKLCKILIITLFFEKNAIFCRKLAKIAENCDLNIDPLIAVPEIKSLPSDAATGQRAESGFTWKCCQAPGTEISL
jgi:hypothetical protein